MKIRATPQGYLAFDRRSGLNVLIDEVVPEKHSTAPAMVSFSLTNRCNLHCPHCFVAKGRSDLPFSLLTKWLVELDENGCLEVGFGGGEPLLHPDFSDICGFVHSQTEMACTFTTNGTLLSEEMVESIRENVDFCRISMDGWDQIHERSREVPFDTLVSTIGNVAGKIRVGVNYLVNDETVGDLDRVARLLESLSAEELLLLPEIGARREILLSGNGISILRGWVASYDGPLRLRGSERTCAEILPSVLPPGDEALFRYVHVDADGIMKPDSFASVGVPIGSGSFLDAFQLLRTGDTQ